MSKPPETLNLILDRLASPVGEVLLVVDAGGAVRALDFHDYEDRLRRLLRSPLRQQCRRFSSSCSRVVLAFGEVNVVATSEPSRSLACYSCGHVNGIGIELRRLE